MEVKSQNFFLSLATYYLKVSSSILSTPRHILRNIMERSTIQTSFWFDILFFYGQDKYSVCIFIQQSIYKNPYFLHNLVLLYMKLWQNLIKSSCVIILPNIISKPISHLEHFIEDLMQAKKQLCKIPDFIEFDYYPEQELHASIQIQNLTDQIVSYKIKTTAPNQYLVKPMEGQIYNKDKAKVVFKRKKLSLEYYQAIQNGTRPFKERFMFVITCKYKNAIGIEKVDEITHIMNVKFGNPKRSNPDIEQSRRQNTDVDQIIKKVKKVKTPEQKRQQNETRALIQSEKHKLENLRKQRQAEQERLQALQGATRESTFPERKMVESRSTLSNQLGLQQIICLLVLAFFLGMFI